jgi:hypothetical protein
MTRTKQTIRKTVTCCAEGSTSNGETTDTPTRTALGNNPYRHSQNLGVSNLGLGRANCQKRCLEPLQISTARYDILCLHCLLLSIALATSMAEAKLHLANEEAEEQQSGKIAVNEMTASVYISSCISIEDQK